MEFRVQFVFDFISPYAYLGWHRAKRELAPQRVRLEPVPVLFAALLDANDTKGPAEIPAKRIYTWKHVVRLAHEQEREIWPPPAHPFNPLLSLRIVTALDSPEARSRAVDAFYAAAWERGVSISDPERVRKLLDEADLPGARLIEAAGSSETKEKLKQATGWAIQKRVFGVPSYVVGEEVFWGQDSVPHLVAYLRGEDPASGRVERWQNLPVGVTRPGAK